MSTPKTTILLSELDDANESVMDVLRRFPVATVFISIVAVLATWSPTAASVLLWDREAIARGQLWRSFTGHLVHAGSNHLFWDAAVFLITGGFIEVRRRRAFRIGILMFGGLIGAALLVLAPAMDFYYGLSALCTTTFVWMLGVSYREATAKTDSFLQFASLIALLIIVAKIIFEFATGRTLFVSELAYGVQPLPVAHALGLTFGMMMVALELRRSKKQNARIGGDPGVRFRSKL